MSDLTGNLSYALSYIGLGKSQFPLVKVVSTVDNQTYSVRDMPDKQKAADTMAKVRLKMNKLKIHLESTVPDKPQVQQLTRNFEAQAYRFTEATPDAEHTSYSVNKGEAVHFCLRQREGGDESLVDEEIITFVALHEMAHCGTTSVGHTPEFWNHFAWLIKQAEALKIYEYMDFAAHPVEYCGIHITDSPTYKEGTKDEL
jgi:hypothetical protein